MLILSPEIVRFDAHAWDDVAAVAIDRIPKRIIEDHSDLGPFAAFADVPEQSIHIVIQRRITTDDIDAPNPGDSGNLIFYTGAPTSPLTRQRITVPCTLISIRSDFPGNKPAIRALTFIAVSADGADPVVSSAAPLNE